MLNSFMMIAFTLRNENEIMKESDHTKGTGTAEIINFIHTDPTIKAWLGLTFVNVNMTCFSGPAWLTLAIKSRSNSIHTLASILADVFRRVANGNVNFTLMSFVVLHICVMHVFRVD